MNKVMQSKSFKILFKFLMITGGVFLLALSTYMFTIPAKFIPGGVTGIASMIEVLSGFSASYTIVIINVPILICAIIFLDKKFAIRTLYGIVCLTLFLEIFKHVELYRFFNNDQPLVTAIIAGCLSGVGIGLMLNCQASPGGTEVLGMLIRKKNNNIKISQILLGMNALIISVGAILYSFIGQMTIENVIIILVCSIVQVIVNTKAIDLIVNGIHAAVKFEIITLKGKELSVALLERTEYGITIINSKGAYGGTDSQLLICVVPKMQISAFKRVLQKCDPNAFVFSINTTEVMGKNFKKRL